MQTLSTDPLVVASLEQLAELEATGRSALLRDGFAGLARQASDLYAALYVLKSGCVRGAEAIDSDPLEDLCGLLQRLAAEVGSAAA